MEVSSLDLLAEAESPQVKPWLREEESGGSPG